MRADAGIMRSEQTLPPDLFREEYVNNKLKLGEIAKKYGLGRTTVQKLKDKYGYQKQARVTENLELKLRPNCELYIALQDLDLSFFPREVEDFKEMWGAGINISDMARKMKRDERELAVLTMDLVDKGKLEPRKNGVFGEVG